MPKRRRSRVDQSQLFQSSNVGRSYSAEGSSSRSATPRTSLNATIQQRIWQSNLTGYFIIGAIILIALGSYLYGSQLTVFFRNFEPSCTIGIGTATITVQAWSADSDCGAMLRGPNNFTGANWAKFLPEQMSGPNTNGSVICEMNVSDRYVTVRDTGNMGSVACTLLTDPTYFDQQ